MQIYCLNEKQTIHVSFLVHLIYAFLRLSQCHIEFMDDKIRMEGPPESIGGLKQKLQERVNYYLNEFDTIELEVNREHFKHIIGKNGTNGNFLIDQLFK